MNGDVEEVLRTLKRFRRETHEAKEVRLTQLLDELIRKLEEAARHQSMAAQRDEVARKALRTGLMITAVFRALRGLFDV